MELQVTVTLSDRLFVLLEDKLPNLGQRMKSAVKKEVRALAHDETSVEVSVSAAPKAPEADAPEAEADAPEADAPEAEAAAAPEAPVRTAVPLRDHREIIREIIHNTRKRFIGEDYKENTTGEAYKKYFRALTAQFILISNELGAAKPSLLPMDKVDDFAAACAALIVGENGEICTKDAPF